MTAYTLPNPFALWRKHRAERRVTRADWEFRIGYLATLDRRLFPGSPPMLEDLRALKLLADSAAYRKGCAEAWRLPLPGVGLPVMAEHARRMAREAVRDGK